jgi:RNA polymerase sigma-70 factor (ECF subfamily)
MSPLFRTELLALLPRLRRFARGLTADPAEADDLVQAACEKAITRHAQWQEGTRLDSWMYKITQNL